MVTVPTTDQFENLTGKVDALTTNVEALLDMVRHLTREHDEDWGALRQFRAEINQRFDKLETEMQTLTGHVRDVQEDIKEIRGHLGV